MGYSQQLRALLCYMQQRYARVDVTLYPLLRGRVVEFGQVDLWLLLVALHRKGSTQRLLPHLGDCQPIASPPSLDEACLEANGSGKLWQPTIIKNQQLFPPPCLCVCVCVCARQRERGREARYLCRAATAALQRWFLPLPHLSSKGPLQKKGTHEEDRPTTVAVIFCLNPRTLSIKPPRLHSPPPPFPSINLFARCPVSLLDTCSSCACWFISILSSSLSVLR